MISSDSSDPGAISCYDPQGSFTGPMEFVVYTDDVVETIDKFVVIHRLYADDATTYAYPSRGGGGASLTT